MAEAQRVRKRRKWDVPAAVPLPSSAVSETAAHVLQPAVHVTAQTAQQQQPVGSQAPTTGQQGSPAMPSSTSAPTTDIIARAKLGAMSVLEKINQDLRAKGSVPMKVFGMKADEDRIRRDVVINDAPGPIRYNLTRRVTQDDVARRTGTQIVVRGQYQPPGGPRVSEEPPLFLKVTPGAVSQEEDSVQQYAVDVAAGEIQHILNGGPIGTYRHNIPPPSSITGAAQAHPQPQPAVSVAQSSAAYFGPPSQIVPPPGVHPPHPGVSPAQLSQPGIGPYQQPLNPSYSKVPPPVQARPQQSSVAPVPLYIGLQATPDFPLASKLRGPGDSFLRHIAGRTDTQVLLKGSGSGIIETAEPLHILVTGGSQAGSNEAVRLAKSLIDTVHEEYKRAHPNGMASQNQPPPYGQQISQGPLAAISAPSISENRTCTHSGPLITQPYPQQVRPRPAYTSNAFPQPQPQGHVMGPYGQVLLHNLVPQPGTTTYPPPSHAIAPYTYQRPENVPPSHMQQPVQPNMYSQQWPANQAHNGYQSMQSGVRGAAAQHHPEQYATQASTSYYPAPQSQGAVQPGLNYPDSSKLSGSIGPTEQPKISTSSNAGAPGAVVNATVIEQQKEGGRRRFKEFKDTPPPVPSQPAPYAPVPMGPPPPKIPAPAGAQIQESSVPMSSPSPRQPMGPPPPRQPMGPPPPRSMGPPQSKPSYASSQGSGNANDSSVSGSLAGLVDYE